MLLLSGLTQLTLGRLPHTRAETTTLAFVIEATLALGFGFFIVAFALVLSSFLPVFSFIFPGSSFTFTFALAFVVQSFALALCRGRRR